jgi:hypothetical protein
MAKYDQGGGCACGLVKECNCTVNNRREHAQAYCGQPEPSVSDISTEIASVEPIRRKKDWSDKVTICGSKPNNAGLDLEGPELSMMLIPKQFFTARIEITNADGTSREIIVSKDRLKAMFEALM